jgi:hypothetical protein
MTMMIKMLDGNWNHDNDDDNCLIINVNCLVHSTYEKCVMLICCIIPPYDSFT